MKLIIVILSSILFMACGDIEPELECDHVVQGLCVITEGHDIDLVKINGMIDIIGSAVFRVYGKTIDLPAMFERANISLTFMNMGDPRLNGNRGISRDNIAYTNSRDCIEKYYVGGHELMHLMARHGLRASDELNHEHMVPNLFLQWAESTGESYKSTVEFDLYMYFHPRTGECANEM